MKKVKKDIKKKVKKETQKTFGQISFRFHPDRMTFYFNGHELFLSRSQACFLFGKNVQLEFEKATNEDDDFSAFETVESLALFSFNSKRHIPNRKIAKKLNFPAAKYLRWINREAGRINSLIKSRQGEINKRVQEFEAQDPLPEPTKERDYWPDVRASTGRKVAVMLLDDLGPREIAKRLKVPYSQFLKWFSDKIVMQNLMIIRNEEAGNRARKNKEIKG